MDKTLSPYQASWGSSFDEEKKLLKEALRDNFFEIHHIGSTSITDLLAKPFIDIVLSVKDLDSVVSPLEDLGYVFKGEFNIPFRYFFAKNNRKTKVNLHVVCGKDPEMEGFLLFRDYMRTHPEALAEYAELKKSIEDKLGSKGKYQYLNEYTLAKNDFIRSILKKAGFKGLCMRFVVHYSEQSYEEEICQKYGFSPKASDRGFIFYKGPDIVGYANASPPDKINIFDLTVDGEERQYFEDRLKRYLEKSRFFSVKNI